MIAGKRYSGLAVDLWSCGVILFAMVCGTLPFEDPNTSLLYKKILTLNYQVPLDISSFAKDILKGLLTSNTQRLSLAKIRSHEFYRLYNHQKVDGIIVAKCDIPVDDNILAEAAKIGYEPQFMRECLMTNKHNSATTAYYLLLKQRHESGFHSIADINSSKFDATLLYTRRNTPISTPRHSRMRSSVQHFLDAELSHAPT